MSDAFHKSGFLLVSGQGLGPKYTVLRRLGGGYEGEVYLISEKLTGIERAVKLFYPLRLKKRKTPQIYANKLHALRDCSVLVKYVSYEKIRVSGQQIEALISEYIDGFNLDQMIAVQPQKKLPSYYALHLLHALARGIEEIHESGEYHGDLHTGNVIVQSQGLIFKLKVIDFFQHSGRRSEKIQEDVFNLVRIFYDCLGGREAYSSNPLWVKSIVCGLKRSLITSKFKTAGQLRIFLENLKISK